jgi:hypothetical protein
MNIAESLPVPPTRRFRYFACGFGNARTVCGIGGFVGVCTAAEIAYAIVSVKQLKPLINHLFITLMSTEKPTAYSK